MVNTNYNQMSFGELGELALKGLRNFQNLACDALFVAIETGKVLIVAKAKAEAMNTGRWTAWLNEHFPASADTATNWMLLAKNEEQVLKMLDEAKKNFVSIGRKPGPKARPLSVTRALKQLRAVNTSTKTKKRKSPTPTGARLNRQISQLAKTLERWENWKTELKPKTLGEIKVSLEKHLALVQKVLAVL
jgi:DNA-binding HxlR family transcriptional regulator